MYCHPHVICNSESPHSPFYVVIILFLHGIVTVIEFHLTYVDNLVSPFYNWDLSVPFPLRLGALTMNIHWWYPRQCPKPALFAYDGLDIVVQKPILPRCHAVGFLFGIARKAYLYLHTFWWWKGNKIFWIDKEKLQTLPPKVGLLYRIWV